MISNADKARLRRLRVHLCRGNDFLKTLTGSGHALAPMGPSSAVNASRLIELQHQYVELINEMLLEGNKE